MSQKQEHFSQHMYSIAGKSSSQLFAYISGRKRTQYSKQKTFDSQSNSITPNKQCKMALKQQPFSQYLSREYLNKLQYKGKPNFTTRIYNPKYSAIQKQTIKLLRKSDLGCKFIIERQSTKKQSNHTQTSIDLSNIKTRRTKGYVDLKRQLSREQYYRQQNNQFLSINYNSFRRYFQQSIKFKRSKSAQFKGFTHSLDMNKNTCLQTSYDIDQEEKQLKQCCDTFVKQIVNDSIGNKSFSLRDQSIYQYDQHSKTKSTIRRFTTTKTINNKIQNYKNEQSISNRRKIKIKEINSLQQSFKQLILK